MSDLADELAILAELFATGGFHELSVRTPGLSVLLATEPSALATDAIERAEPSVPSVAMPTIDAPLAAASAPPALTPASAINPAWMAVVAPNLGTFYRSPKPGAAPFVEVGSTVAANDEVCLLEVMKLFTSVTAGVAGVVCHVAASDAQLVEGGQILFHIKPLES